MIRLLVLMLSLVVPGALADPLSVETLKLVEQVSYQLARTYGGQISPGRESALGFEFAGVVKVVHKDEGDHVEQGEPLMALDMEAARAQLRGALSNLASARATLTAQRAQLKLSAATLERHENLVKTGHASAQRLDELRMQHQVDKANILVFQTRLAAVQSEVDLIQVNLDKLNIKAPYDGVVQARMVDEGSIVAPGQTAMVIVESGLAEARIGLPESMTPYLASGVSYEFKINQRAVPGTLKAILPRVDQSTGTVTAIFQLEGERLYAGSLAEMKLVVDVNEPGFWIPLNSLAESRRGLWSVLVVNNNVVESRLVEILYRDADAVYVRGTIEDGELIVASGTNRIVPGQSVTLAGAVGK